MEALNIELLKRMEKLGFTAYSLSKKITEMGRPIKPNSVANLVKSTNYPTEDICEKICFILDAFPEELFQMVRKSREEIVLDIDSLDEQILPPDEMIIKKEEAAFLQKAIGILGKQERFAILRYFGFVERQNGNWTYETIGQAMGKVFPGQSGHIAGSSFARERVRQIIACALKKMRINFFRMGIK